MTAPGLWDPKILDFNLSEQPDWYDTLCELNTGVLNDAFDEFGNYRKRKPASAITHIPDPTAPVSDPSPKRFIEHDDLPPTPIPPARVTSKPLKWISRTSITTVAT